MRAHPAAGQQASQALLRYRDARAFVAGAGVYADLDIEALCALGPLLAGQQLVLAAVTHEAAWEHSIPNAWMASARQHPLWLVTLAHILKAAARNVTDRHSPPWAKAGVADLLVACCGLHKPAWRCDSLMVMPSLWLAKQC